MNLIEISNVPLGSHNWHTTNELTQPHSRTSRGKKRPCKLTIQFRALCWQQNPTEDPTKDTTYLERMTLVRISDWLMDALRVVDEFEWTFNMQRNAKPARPHPFQGKDVLYSYKRTKELILSYSKSKCHGNQIKLVCIQIISHTEIERKISALNKKLLQSHHFRSILVDVTRIAQYTHRYQDSRL